MVKLHYYGKIVMIKLFKVMLGEVGLSSTCGSDAEYLLALPDF